jgi:GNAT superfamily N-acetyltransferase
MNNDEHGGVRRRDLTVRIDYLADHLEAIPMLAEWHHAAWSSITPHLTVEDRVTGFRLRARRGGVPTGFVAVVQGAVVGLACLVNQDMETRQDLTPWLASVLVAAPHRRRGIGSALSDRVADEAFSQGFSRLYLLTFGSVTFYARLGWHVLEEAHYLGTSGTIMQRDRGGAASPRAT